MPYPLVPALWPHDTLASRDATEDPMSQVAECVARAHAGVNAAAVRPVMVLVHPITFLTER
jgi:hypothetical protein